MRGCELATAGEVLGFRVWGLGYGVKLATAGEVLGFRV
jgi:hypothetical protein